MFGVLHITKEDMMFEIVDSLEEARTIKKRVEFYGNGEKAIIFDYDEFDKSYYQFIE